MKNIYYFSNLGSSSKNFSIPSSTFLSLFHDFSLWINRYIVFFFLAILRSKISMSCSLCASLVLHLLLNDNEISELYYNISCYFCFCYIHGAVYSFWSIFLQNCNIPPKQKNKEAKKQRVLISLVCSSWVDPAGCYFLKVNNKTLGQGVKFVQS